MTAQSFESMYTVKESADASVRSALSYVLNKQAPFPIFCHLKCHWGRSNSLPPTGHFHPQRALCSYWAEWERICGLTSHDAGRKKVLEAIEKCCSAGLRTGIAPGR
jgi:hypothetical protein